MAIYAFPADGFVVQGDPEAVRESGRSYGRFATLAGETAAGLRGQDSAFWIGSEGDLFRARVAEIPPHLDTAHSAFAQVAGALGGFADVLADAKGQMTGIRADAEQTFESLAGARAARAGLREPSGEEAAANPAAQTAYEEDERALDRRIDQLQVTWDDQAASADGVNARVLEAARRAGHAIRAAGRTSPTASQSWLEDAWEKGTRWVSGWVDDLKGFVAEHAEAFRGLAKVMRVVGIALVAVGAVLAVLGVGTVVMTAGFVLWGASDALEATVDWAEGKITAGSCCSAPASPSGSAWPAASPARSSARAWSGSPPGWRRSATSSGWPTPGRRSPAPSRPGRSSRGPERSRTRRWPPTASRP
jgi:hypothetical protein